MEPCLSLALLADSMGLVINLVALSTDFWIEVVGPIAIHAGLWLKGPVEDYIHVTQGFSISAALLSLVALIFLVWSFIPLLTAPAHSLLVSTKTAFAAALCMIVAMSVYTSENLHKRVHSQLQVSFGWSFYLGWISAILLLFAGALSLAAHCGSRRAEYRSI
ncbi:PREDICTED: protein NKG7 [Chrysochloris asiatica]|uniref:Protein NKG7 n=1 Tax=Chrysochloris asiatica TaxID=185453 RepID=A0A9B0TQ71_CHRAS|nr:PREDICTED: protein NKG7 [Chrysochloris asiatica]